MSYPPTIATEPDLVAWWRLGESGTWPTDAPKTPNFCLDSSGNGNNLTALNQDRDRNVWFPPGSTTGMPTLHAPGTPAHNDGAIRFHQNDFQWISWDYELCLVAGADVGFAGVSLDEGWIALSPPGDGASFMFWTCFVPLTDPLVLTSMVPFTPPYGTYPQLFGDWSHSFGIGSWGRKGGYDLETGAFTVLSIDIDFGDAEWTWTGPEWTPYEWHQVAVTVAKTSPGQYRRRLYVDGALTESWDGDRLAVGLARNGANLTIGGAWEDDLRFGHCAGGMDEFSVWRRELSAAEILDFAFPLRGVHLSPTRLVA